MTSKVRVVVVDDHRALPAALSSALSSHAGLEVVGTASDVDSAVATVLEQRPHVVLMDVRMPGGGGAEATRRIVEAEPQVRILALSAHEDRASVVEMLGAGAVGYVVKGTPLADLIQAVRSAAIGGMPLSDGVRSRLIGEVASRLAWEDQSRRRFDRHRDVILRALDNGIEPVYQPIFELASGRVVGLEALARFPHHAALPPKVWFTAAAELGLGPELDAAAMGAAVRGASTRPQDVFLAVNVSPAGVQRALRAEQVADAIDQRLVVELTEHAPVHDYPALLRALQPLRQAGVRIAVDDAGAGYASLQHILHLAPDFIKLDIGLTAEIDREPAKRALASALVGFASEIGAEVIAEGAETSGEVGELRRLGIRLAQGFALGRPMALAEALRWRPPLEDDAPAPGPTRPPSG